jgi:ribose-phosphate pyrophosphokinase
LAEALKPFERRPVVVAPDLGATKLAERYAHILEAPVAIIHKTRLSGAEVSVERVVGEVAGRMPVLVDDMVSTGGTLEAAARALISSGSEPSLVIAATHALLVHSAAERLASLPVRTMAVTDSLPAPAASALPLEVVSLAPLLAEAIRRLHAERSLGELSLHE